MSDSKALMVAETDRFFREIVLCLGGIFSIQECPDDVVWQVTKSLEHIYHRNRARLLQREHPGESELPPRRAEPHPAVEDLLSRIGRQP